MKKHMNFTVIVPGLILVSVLLVVGYQFIFTSQGIKFPSINLGLDRAASPDFRDPGDLMAYRWNAMAQAYEKAGLLNSRYDADELTTYRWNAMAQVYADQGMLNYHDNPDDLSAYRWLATARGYEALGLLNYHNNPDDLSAYRWNAMAEVYQRMGLLNTP